MKYIDNKDICELVREAETNFISGGGTQMSKYVSSDLYEDISKIYAYLESKHISGEKDHKGRDKPFFNIVTAARNIYYRATDIDRKHITVKPTKAGHFVPAFVATVLLQNWMRRENYGAFLNDLGMELAGFNEAVVKHVESDGLHPMVVPWSRLIVDQINFDANPKIEILELTEAELYQRKGYDKEMVEKLCEALEARELTDGTKQDQKSNYIKLYEIHGNLPISYLTGKDKDEDEYVQQMHVISFVESKAKGEYDDFTLVSGREEKDPYMKISLLPSTDGSINLNGAVKNLFQSQWMLNHSVKSIKDRQDLASKLFFQTADGNYVGRNVVSAIENGDILIHAANSPITQVNNTDTNITVQESFMSMWKGLAAEINGISESMMGAQSPSGTAWRQVQAELAEAHSLFELMTENKGLGIEKMLRTYVIPYLKKQMDTTEEIAATLEANGITQLDAMYVPAEAVKRFKRDAVKKVLEMDVTKPVPPEGIVSPYIPELQEAEVKKEMAPLGNQRFIKPSDIPTVTWKEVCKDLEWDLEVDITGESMDKKVALETINTALVAVTNPMYANNPAAQMLVGKALSLTGTVSPLEIAAMPAPPPMPVPTAAPPASVGLPVAQ